MNEKRATSQDVARLAGVSRTTVSFVLNNIQGVKISEATRAKIHNAARELNYLPNVSGRKLVSGKSNTIGLVLLQSFVQVQADANLINVMLGVEKAASEFGYHVLLKHLEKNVSSYTHLIRENSVDGIILSGPRKDDENLIRMYHEGFPVVLMGQLPGSDLPSVDIDNQKAAAEIVSHLISLNHRHIAMITNAPIEFTSAQQRISGYQEALRAGGIEPDPAYIKAGNYTPESGRLAMKVLLETIPHLSAVFIASDVVAIGAIQAITDAGLRIPQDISVAGFDDIPLAGYFTPPLTTMRLPSSELGFAAGKQLLRILQGEKLETTPIILKSDLIVRSSSLAKENSR